MKKSFNKILGVVLCLLFTFNFSSCDNSQSVPEPANGYVFEGINAEYGSYSLTLTAKGTGGHYFILNAVSLYCSEPVGSYEEITFRYLRGGDSIKFYVHGNSTVDIQIPKGEYEIYYATGDTWYGEEELFGKDTVYKKCDTTFSFYDDFGQPLSIPDGNFSISKILASEFPN